MDRYELVEELRAAGVPAARYEIAGLPGGPWFSDHLFLEERAAGWVVGFQERGRRGELERFPDEDRACRHFHRLLTDPGPPAVPLTPAECDEVLHHSEDIQRRAREELARALDAARRRPQGGAGPPAR